MVATLLELISLLWCIMNSVFIIIVIIQINRLKKQEQIKELQNHQSYGQIYTPHIVQPQFEYEQPQVRETFSPKEYPKNENTLLYTVKQTVFNDNKSTNDRITQLKKLLK